MSDTGSVDRVGQGTSAPAPDPSKGLRSVVLGSLLAVLAPLGGFLGGSMAGTSGPLDDVDPLFIWLFVGMVVGGIGVAIAIRGGLQWVRANYARQG